MVRGADANAKDRGGGTALLRVTEENHRAEVVEAIVGALLERGADPNAPGRVGRTPLMYAASFGHVEAVNALLEGGADVNAVDNDGMTPLLFAVGRDAVTVLLEGSADVNAAGENGETPLMKAASYDLVADVNALLVHGADVNVQDGDGRTAEASQEQKLMSENLRDLAVYQKAYFSDLNTYATSVSELGYQPWQGVTIEVVAGSADGWYAIARHADSDEVCRMRVGSVGPEELPDGNPVCE